MIKIVTCDPTDKKDKVRFAKEVERLLETNAGTYVDWMQSGAGKGVVLTAIVRIPE